ncbi:HAMP domain-containing histidine kinase [Arthrobacter crusticola]|uniref:histidine kinase n=1 Tax=Arthrobacter crusticola TaxID=2547960 RepID=A0A4R5TX77_9MICC|nr:HAMP domain-containing sensor histidine kinase [Arthrobacter crusticola]TDK25777.1 HAMP domain-containing histidine kinase [Arthrobacter crusticola]
MAASAGEASTSIRGRFDRRWPFSAWKLRTKLLVVTLALLAAICAAVTGLSYAVMEVVLTQQLDGRLQEASNRTLELGDPAPLADAEQTAASTGFPAQVTETLSALKCDGEVVRSGLFTADGEHTHLSPSDVQTLNDLPELSPPVERSLSIGEYRLMAVQEEDEDGDGEPDILITGLATEAKDTTLDALGGTMATISLAGLAATGITARKVIRRTLRPLNDLSEVATAVSEMPLNQGEVALAARAAPGSPRTEVGSVGNAFNKMLDNVAYALNARQRSETQVRQFVADASHELRTPLAAIRSHAELIRLAGLLNPQSEASLRRVESESARMSTLVEDLLLLARLDEGHAGPQESVDLTELAVEAVSDMRVAARGHQWSVHLPGEPVLVDGNKNQLRQVLLNLLSNAHKHTGPGTTIVTSLTPGPTEATLTVTDDGPGIDPGFIDKMFARFTRADEARTGGQGTSGLGLSIVEAIVAAHHGSIDVRSEPGNTTFTVRFPAAAHHG